LVFYSGFDRLAWFMRGYQSSEERKRIEQYRNFQDSFKKKIDKNSTVWFYDYIELYLPVGTHIECIFLKRESLRWTEGFGGRRLDFF
jgi:hypothetical protein